MKSFAIAVRIAAPAERVWALLTDMAGWTKWNTTVDKVQGSASPGSSLTVYAKASPGRAFPLKVTEFIPPTRMVWRGGMPLGFFTGTRTFSVTRQPDGTVSFEMTETYSGIVAPLIVRSIPDLQPAFAEFANCLKRAAESA